MNHWKSIHSWDGTTTANYLQFIDFGEHENQFRTPFVNSFAKNKNGWWNEECPNNVSFSWGFEINWIGNEIGDWCTMTSFWNMSLWKAEK